MREKNGGLHEARTINNLWRHCPAPSRCAILAFTQLSAVVLLYYSTFNRECKSPQFDTNFSFKMPFKQSNLVQIVASVLIKLKVIANRGNFS